MQNESEVSITRLPEEPTEEQKEFGADVAAGKTVVRKVAAPKSSPLLEALAATMKGHSPATAAARAGMLGVPKMFLHSILRPRQGSGKKPAKVYTGQGARERQRRRAQAAALEAKKAEAESAVILIEDNPDLW